jgi:copper ion binding protein
VSTITATYEVSGMSCQHCVDAVTAEVGRIAGVEQVEVDLASGRVTVVSTNDLDHASVQDAIDEAGYELVGPA